MDENGGILDHETTTKFEYMEAAIEEDLRLFPPVTFLDRTCVKDVNIGNIKFHKGFPIWAIHRFHENFEKPLEFMPERFLKPMKDNITPYAYVPFGGGPRKCIGMRFAMVEMKLALAKLIKTFKIVDVPNQTNLNMIKGDSAFLSYNGVKVKLEVR